MIQAVPVHNRTATYVTLFRAAQPLLEEFDPGERHTDLVEASAHPVYAAVLELLVRAWVPHLQVRINRSLPRVLRHPKRGDELGISGVQGSNLLKDPIQLSPRICVSDASAATHLALRRRSLKAPFHIG